jgi:hypothetical protein
MTVSTLHLPKFEASYVEIVNIASWFTTYLALKRNKPVDRIILLKLSVGTLPTNRLLINLV